MPEAHDCVLDSFAMLWSIAMSKTEERKKVLPGVAVELDEE